jgi:hypothetical protein
MKIQFITAQTYRAIMGSTVTETGNYVQKLSNSPHQI